MQARLLLADRMSSLGTLAAGVAHEINNPLAYVRDEPRADEQAVAGARRPRRGPSAASRPSGCAASWSARREGAERVRLIVRGLKSFSQADDETVERDRSATRAGHVDHDGLERDPPPGAVRDGLRRAARRPGQRGATRAGVPEPARQRDAGDPGGRRRAQRDPRLRDAPTPRGARSSRSATRAPGSRPTTWRSSSTRSSPPRRRTWARASGWRSATPSSPRSTGRSPSRASPAWGPSFASCSPASRASLPAAALPTVPCHPRSSRRGHLLVIDDEEDICEVMKEALSPSHDVVTTTDARRALELLAAGQRLRRDPLRRADAGDDGHRLSTRSSRPTNPDQASRVVLMSGGFTRRPGEPANVLSRPVLEKPFELEQVLVADARRPRARTPRAPRPSPGLAGGRRPLDLQSHHSLLCESSPCEPGSSRRTSTRSPRWESASLNSAVRPV